jgi:hypothetical protein
MKTHLARFCFQSTGSESATMVLPCAAHASSRAAKALEKRNDCSVSSSVPRDEGWAETWMEFAEWRRSIPDCQLQFGIRVIAAKTVAVLPVDCVCKRPEFEAIESRRSCPAAPQVSHTFKPEITAQHGSSLGQLRRSDQRSGTTSGGGPGSLGRILLAGAKVTGDPVAIMNHGLFRHKSFPFVTASRPTSERILTPACRRV